MINALPTLFEVVTTGKTTGQPAAKKIKTVRARG
jgi:hypothetical protein